QYQYDSGLGFYDFIDSIKAFHPITLRRRYAAELAEIEEQYVALLEEGIIPCISQYEPEDRRRGPRLDLPHASMEFCSSLFYLQNQSPETIERLAKALFSLRSYSSYNNFVWHISESHEPAVGWDQMNQWVREYGDDHMVFNYY